MAKRERCPTKIPFTIDYSNRKLRLGKYVIVPFNICLREEKAFQFVVDVLEVVESP